MMVFRAKGCTAKESGPTTEGELRRFLTRRVASAVQESPSKGAKPSGSKQSPHSEEILRWFKEHRRTCLLGLLVGNIPLLILFIGYSAKLPGRTLPAQYAS